MTALTQTRMVRTFDFTISEGKLETELVECTEGGDITGWYLWSPTAYDWVPQNIEWLKKEWPSRYDELIAQARNHVAETLALAEDETVLFED